MPKSGRETIKMSEVSSPTRKRIIYLNDTDYRIINEDLNLDLKRIGKGIKEVISLYFDLKLKHSSIDANKQLFIPVKELKRHSKKHYKLIKDSICVMKGNYSILEGKCDQDDTTSLTRILARNIGLFFLIIVMISILKRVIRLSF